MVKTLGLYGTSALVLLASKSSASLTLPASVSMPFRTLMGHVVYIEKVAKDDVKQIYNQFPFSLSAPARVKPPLLAVETLLAIVCLQVQNNKCCSRPLLQQRPIIMLADLLTAY